MIKSKIQSRKEREKKPWLSNLFRRFGTPIGPLREPAHESMDGRWVGTSMNDIRVLRPPDLRVMSVNNAIRQIKRNKNHEIRELRRKKTENEVNLYNPLLNQNTVTQVKNANHLTKPARPKPVRHGKLSHKSTSMNEVIQTRNEVIQTRKSRLGPKRIDGKVSNSPNKTTILKPRPKPIHKVTTKKL